MTFQESDTQEFKRSFSQIEPSLKSFCGFLNHHGGIITFGRSDTGEPIGITPSDHGLRKLSQQITSRIKPEISPDIRVIDDSGVHLVTVTVPEGANKPYFLDGMAYIRVGTENRVIPPDELKRIILTTGQPPWESEICPDATLDDINPNLITEFLTKVQDERRLGVEKNTPAATVLEKLHLLNNNHPTNAAILLFGKEPQDFILQSEVRCGHFSGGDVTSPFINMKVIRGDLLHQIEDTMGFILSGIRRSAHVPAGKTRREEHWEYPPDALREAVINALCHRDYRSSGNAQVRIFTSTMKILNPGSLPPELPIESLKTEHLSLPRNVLIAQVLFLSGYIEQWGSGTNHMIESCRSDNLPDPEFSESDQTFTVTFRSSTTLSDERYEDRINDRQKQILEYLRNNVRITTTEYAGMFGCTQKTAQRDLSELVSLRVIQKSGKTRGVFYTRSDSFGTFTVS